MGQNKNKKSALIDIKPIDEYGIVEFEFEPVVKLKNIKRISVLNNDLKDALIAGHINELEKTLNGKLDLRIELARIGAKVQEAKTTPDHPEVNLDKVLNEINNSALYLRPEPPGKMNIPEKPNQIAEIPEVREENSAIISEHAVRPKKRISRKLIIAIIIIAISIILGRSVLALRNNIVQNGSSAVTNLEQAKTDLEQLKFTEALIKFSNANSEFSKAGGSLNLMGSFFGGLIAEIPGNTQYKSARNLVEAGKLFSKSGESLVKAVNSISQISSILNPSSTGPDAVRGLKMAFLESQANIHRASQLLADLDVSVIPEDKKGPFIDFKDKLPELVKMVDKGVEYSMFLESLIAVNGSRQYLVLFPNPSELRPAGGFAGSYAIARFKNGRLEEFKVDDVYNLDGQLKDNIIPPKELQHITPTLGMRDAGWFLDFPASAKKTAEFFKKEAGYEVDGVITFSPVIVREILKILGPIDLPEYGMTLDHNNFLTEIQAEIEYGENRVQPKTVLFYFAPRLLEKIYSAEPHKWLEIFNVLASSLENKNMLVYFKEPSLQNFALKENVAGEIKNIQGADYFFMGIANVKGSKTDMVTDTSLKIDTEIKDKEAIHTVTITRKHNGGDSEFGFYNRPNPAYVRILVPADSELIGVSGQSAVDYKPLLDYAGKGFTEDRDIKNLESTVKETGNNIFEYKEAGKKGLGFWIVAEPGKTKTVKLEYKTSINIDNEYNLYIQKQPGLEIKNMDLSFQLPLGKRMIGSNMDLSKIGDLYKINPDFISDLDIILKI